MNSIWKAIALASASCLAWSMAGAEEPGSPPPRDELGAVGTLGPEAALAAAKLVKSGKVYSLAIETGDKKYADKPFGIPRSYSISLSKQVFNGNIGLEDRLSTDNGYWGTSIDGLAHIARGERFFNGFGPDEVIGPEGARKFEIAKIPPIVTRGILLDVAGFEGVESLPARMAVGRAMIEAIEKRQGIAIRAGDVVLLHTGWGKILADNPDAILDQAGLNLEGAQYLAERGVVAVGADNMGVEYYPRDEHGRPKPEVHAFLLADRGIHLLEGVKTDELAKDKGYMFMFVLGLPRLKNAVQSPANPIAIR